jgi:hypothetical protein
VCGEWRETRGAVDSAWVVERVEGVVRGRESPPLAKGLLGLTCTLNSSFDCSDGRSEGYLHQSRRRLSIIKRYWHYPGDSLFDHNGDSLLACASIPYHRQNTAHSRLLSLFVALSIRAAYEHPERFYSARLSPGGLSSTAGGARRMHKQQLHPHPAALRTHNARKRALSHVLRCQ